MTTTLAQMIGDAKAQVEEIAPMVAAEEIASGSAVVVDVREPVEWESHIEGALQIPRGLLEFMADPASPKHNPELNPSRRVIVYCRSGSRAALAAVTLKELGFEKVANLKGGFSGWTEAGLPVAEHHADL